VSSITAPSTRANTGQWRDALAAWCEECLQLLSRSWSQPVAVALFERLEAHSELAELVADSVVSDATVELTVYLCTFADAAAQPDPEKRARLELLVRHLKAALEAHGESNVAAPVAAPPVRHFRIYYVRPHDRDRSGLAAALGQQRVVVLPLESLDAFLLAIGREQPDAVIVDGSLLKDLRALTEGARRSAIGSWRRVLWAATGIDDDTHLRLFARRAGIDVILDDDTAERAAGTLLAAMLRRRDQSYRVLLIEDDRSQVTFCTSLLRHQGFEVDVAATAAAALDALKTRVPDLILLDINLPDMSGVELAQLMREQDSLAHVPLVFLTGEDDMDVRAEAIAAGGDDFLTKPVRPRHLIANVNSRIERARSLAQAAQAEPIEEGLSPRLDRVRFVEAMDRQRRDSTRCLAVAVLAMDDIGAVAARLGFVRTGDLALQIALAIESEASGVWQTCGIGEFSRLVLFDAESEHGLRNAVNGLLAKLDTRAWLSTSFPLRVRFSAGVARFDRSPADADAVIVEALSVLDATRRSGGTGLGFRSLTPIDGDASDPLQRIVRLMLGQPLTPMMGQLQFRPLMPLRGTRVGQFLLQTRLVPPGARRTGSIGPEIYAGIAGSIGAGTAVDRLSLRLVKDYARSALVAKHGWRVLLPVSESSLQEPLFPDWLQREAPSSSDLLLVVRAARLRPGSGLAAAIDRVAQRGWHWVLQVESPDEFEAEVLVLGNLDAILLGSAPGGEQDWTQVLQQAGAHGKSIIASGVDDVRQVGALFTHGVHYAIGESVGEWSTEPAFDAARPREL
jgi:CheY-like chemotaxis protein